MGDVHWELKFDGNSHPLAKAPILNPWPAIIGCESAHARKVVKCRQEWAGSGGFFVFVLLYSRPLAAPSLPGDA